jgi:sugar lactone lactonase YvrE
MGGQQPLIGAHVFVLEANTTGYGGAGIAASSLNQSKSLLQSYGSNTTLDNTMGDPTFGDYYVTTGPGGAFSVTGDYSCTLNSQVYLYSIGGTQGGVANPAATLLAAGNCPSGGSFPSGLYVVLNEVSTVATAYALAGFATDALHISSSGTPLAQTGIFNADANAVNLENIATGTALTTTPAGNGTVPQATINTLANILAACVNTNGVATGPTNPTACYTLFTDALAGGTTGAQPTDTATAAINIAHNPVANITPLYALSLGSPPFAPALTAQPKDFTISLRFTAGGLSGVRGIAIDAAGDAWVANQASPSNNTVYDVTELSPTGSFLSGTSGYTTASLNEPYGIAIDLGGNAWVTNFTGSSVTKLSPSGSNLSAAGYTGTLNEPNSVAIDAGGDAWVTSYDLLLTKFSNTGSELSPSFEGYNGGGILEPSSVAIDGSGEVWVANDEVLGRNPTPAIAVFSSTGVALTGSGITGGGLDDPLSIAVDSSGNAWVADYYSGVIEINNLGTIVSGTSGITGGGFGGSDGIAIDGSGNVWIANLTSLAITEVSNSGTVLSGANGYTISSSSGSADVAVDGSGDVWATSYPGVVEIIGAATPVITPIAAGLPATPTADGTSNLGTRP